MMRLRRVRPEHQHPLRRPPCRPALQN